MVGITEASAAVSGIKAAYDMAKGVQALTADVAVKMATIELMQAILSAQQSALAAQEAQATLMGRVTDLETRLASHDDWKTEQARYSLTRYPTGSMVYVLRPECANGEATHRLCPTCFQKGNKSILQIYSTYGGETVTCLPCDNKIVLSESSEGPIDYGRSGDPITGY